MNNDGKIYCSRCGAEMNSNSRYCMNCGNLNPEHEANKNMMPYIQSNQASYNIGQGGVNLNTNKHSTSVLIGNNMGNFTLCFLINIFLYIGSLGLIFYHAYINNFKTVSDFINMHYPLIIMVVSYFYVLLYSLQLIAMKCNRKWYSGIIPIYNCMLLSEIVFKNKWFGLITVIPIIGQILLLVMIYKLGIRFKYNGLLCVLLFPIMIPVMGFGSHSLDGNIYVDKVESTFLEKSYKKKRLFSKVACFFIVLGFVSTFWTYFMSLGNDVKKSKNVYYKIASKQIVTKIKNGINRSFISCDGVSFNKENGDYYFYYPDLGKRVFIPFYLMNDSIEAFIRVNITNSKPSFYITMTDGTYGFDETLYENINNNTVKKFDRLLVDYKSFNICDVGK